MSTDLSRPSWVTADDGWGPVTSPRDWNERTNRTHRRLVFVIVALATTLAATLALAIVATLDQERAFDDVYLRWQLAESEIVQLTAERDLANEAWTQCSGLPLGGA